MVWSDRRDKHATGKALAQIVTTGMIGSPSSEREQGRKDRPARIASAGWVYREVSFNELFRVLEQMETDIVLELGKVRFV